MNVLITGGAGFIGSHLAEIHLRSQDSVYVVDDLSSGRMENINPLLSNPNFRFSQANIVTWDKLSEVATWADRIYHMAAIVGVKKVLSDPRAVIGSNIAGTERIFRAIEHKGHRTQVILASTSEVYGFNPKQSFSEEDDLIFQSGSRLRWCYAVTKLADEYVAYAYKHQCDVNVTIARIFNSIGPHQTGRYGWVVPTFIKQALANEPVTVYGNGLQTRSFCDVRDTARALKLLAESKTANGEIVNVGNDHEISILDLAKLIIQLTNSSSTIQFVSYRDAYGVDFEEINHRRPILKKLISLTGFQPNWTLIKTLEDLIATERGQLHHG